MRVLVFVFLLSSTPLIAQENYIPFEDLTFHSEFERQHFERFLENPDEANYFQLFLAVDPQMTVQKAAQYERSFHAILKNFSTERFLKKRNDKKVKKIYEGVHAELLKKYEMQNHFNQIFTNGSYNCVSATALYGLAFNQLDIPYIIKEKPTHVYLMTYPKSEPVLVETTDPSGNFFSLNNRYKTAVVEKLRDAKMISTKEFESKTVDQLFNEFYFSDDDITLKELVGIQYLNDALYHLEEEQTFEGFEQLEKAAFFYPSDKLKLVLATINVQILHEENYQDIRSIDYLIKLTRYQEILDLSDNDIVAEFERMADLVLNQKGDTARYKSYFEKFLVLNSNEKLEHDIRYIYNLHYGLMFYNRGRYDEALTYIEKAYTLQPDNLKMTDLFIATMAENLRYESNYEAIIAALEQYALKYPKLMKHVVFKSMLANTYLIASGQAYELESIKKGEKYRLLFEKIHEPELNIFMQNVGRAYSLAAVYYFKRRNKSKALRLIEQGLKYAPGNHELLTRKRMMR